MTNQSKLSLVRLGLGVLGTVALRTLRIAASSAANRQRLIMVLLCLTAFAFANQNVTNSQPQDTSRKIVSDDFAKGRRAGVARAAGGRKGAKRRRTYRLVSDPTERRETPARKFMQLGITIWRLRPPKKEDAASRALLREKGRVGGWAAERVESVGRLREGDYVRISVEATHIGYLYVIDQDLFADGTTGEPMLIFPWSGADNRLAPGHLIDIPTQEDDPNYFTARLTRPNQVGELLTFIVTAAPLEVAVSDKPLPIPPKKLSDWQKLWGGVTERYEMEGGTGEVWTQEEQQAAAKNGRRQLTRDDPVPQTIYRVFNTNNRGMLVNLRLQYGN